MKSKLLLLAILSGLSLSSCDALDSFFAESKDNQQQAANTSSNGNSNNEGKESSNEETNTTQTGEDNNNNTSSIDEENNNQTNTDNNNPSTNTGETENNNPNEDNGGSTTHEENPSTPATGGDDNPSTPTSGGSTDNPTPGESGEEEEETPKDERYIALPKRSIDLLVGSTYKDMYVNYYPSVDSFEGDTRYGTWSSSNDAVASVDPVKGFITGVSEGQAVISFTTDIDHYVGSMVVYVSNTAFSREYVKVDDVDSIQPGDELIFACPDFGVAASINEKDYWIDPTPISFKENNTKLTGITDDVASFIVGTSKQGSDVFTLETQDGKFLAAKKTDRHRSLYYFKTDKAQIDWFVERPDGYSEDFVVNYNLQEDYWLMFNKISSTDIRFNIYDSNEQTLMKKPTIYRNTVIH